MAMASSRTSRSGFFRPPIFYSGDRHYAAWRAYSDGDFARAVRLYADAIKLDSTDYSLHGARARAFYMLAQYDSALAEMTRMLERARAAETERLTPVYQSKASSLYSIALIHVARRDHTAARDALERALGEDIAFYMADAALGDVHLMLGDTAAAIAEHDIAVQLESRDPALRQRYALVLIAAQRFEQAVAQLRDAIALNADYSHPYFALAFALEQTGHSQEAIEAYDAFLQRAPRTLDEQIAAASRRLIELRGVSGAVP